MCGVAHLMDICLVGPGARSSNHGSKGAESEDGFVCVGNVMLKLISQDSLSYYNSRRDCQLGGVHWSCEDTIAGLSD